MPEIKSRFAETAVIAALTALTAVTTLLVRVPIPATNGYFNIGDVFIILAGLWLGPGAGFIAGAFGSAMADAIGFPVYIPATFLVKGFEGWLTGFLAGHTRNLGRSVLAACAGGCSMVLGYYLFEAVVYPAVGAYIPMFQVTDPAAALIALVPNAIQGIAGVVGGLALWKAVSATNLSRTEFSEQTQAGPRG